MTTRYRTTPNLHYQCVPCGVYFEQLNWDAEDGSSEAHWDHGDLRTWCEAHAVYEDSDTSWTHCQICGGRNH
jgi:hypothetical protein